MPDVAASKWCQGRGAGRHAAVGGGDSGLQGGAGGGAHRPLRLEQPGESQRCARQLGGAPPTAVAAWHICVGGMLMLMDSVSVIDGVSV